MNFTEVTNIQPKPGYKFIKKSKFSDIYVLEESSGDTLTTLLFSGDFPYLDWEETKAYAVGDVVSLQRGLVSPLFKGFIYRETPQEYAVAIRYAGIMTIDRDSLVSRDGTKIVGLWEESE